VDTTTTTTTLEGAILSKDVDGDEDVDTADSKVAEDSATEGDEVAGGINKIPSP
jgi:hypothetical protein